MITPLPVAQPWFRSTTVSSRLTRIDEPHVSPFIGANVWHLRGDDRDLIVDAGLGVASLTSEHPELLTHDPILVVTHAHLDHMGSAHEFPTRWAHADETLDAPAAGSLFGGPLAHELGLDAELPELLIDAVPHTGFDATRFRILPAPPTRTVRDGDEIDLGDVRLRVLHLPGHTPGSICLFDEEHGVLFSGDVIYDEYLLDELHGSSIPDYVASLRRLRTLPVQVVHPGHGDSFEASRLHELIDEYLAMRTGG